MKRRTLHTKFGDIRYWVSKRKRDEITLVFLPGLTTDARLFTKQLEYFEDKYNMMVWDPPGHNRSRPFSLDFFYEDIADWLHEILKKEGFKNVIIVGQSMGGYIGQVLSEYYPEDLEGFIAINSIPLQPRYVPEVTINTLERFGEAYYYIPFEIFLHTSPISCAQTPYGRDLMKKMLLVYRDNPKYYADLVNFYHKILTRAYRKDLAYKLHCPVLLICGLQDKTASVQLFNERWAREEGFPVQWIDGAGHNANTDQPDLVNQIIEDFARTIKTS